MRLTIPHQLLTDAIAQALAESPNECCGLFAGRGDTVTHRFPLINALASPTRFESSGESMFAAMRAMRPLDIDVLAVYHSHPTSDPTPSRTDREQHYADDVAAVIISLASHPPAIEVWRMRERQFECAEWEAVNSNPPAVPSA